MTEISKITAKGQTTVPRKIRTAAGMSTGDMITWEVSGDGYIRVRRVDPVDVAYLRGLESTHSEWLSEADEDAYHDL